MTTFILEYDEVDCNEGCNDFGTMQFKQRRGCASQHELNEAISNLSGGTNARYNDGIDWHYFTAGQTGSVVIPVSLPKYPL
jgi:hypothetical protein